MKRIVLDAELSSEQKNIVSALAAATGLCVETVGILYSRGIDTADKIDAFIHPGKKHFFSPLLMRGMNEAVRLITRARDEDWSVLIYGDYDADGVCASTVLYRCLREFGIEATVFVPERRMGYGLNVSALDDIFEEVFPQLVITVDCGISNAEEVEYIKEQGAEVIVTDHHELPEKLPDCICINPKFDDDYPADNLCGAGVAFKLGCALIGTDAYKYLDFTAIATVADSVPLTKENRDIVSEGLALINKSARANYAEFINKTGEKVTAQTLAFSVAPKINAAGRMGDANAALSLFLSDDGSEIYDLSVKLAAYNIERQKYCDELYLSAKEKIKQKGAKGRVIVLSDESWNTGFVGIVAARLAEEYCRPTLLFVKHGDLLKGSARSIDGVNIFEALKSCAELIEEFGGHSQAAGINIEARNLGKLEEALNAYFKRNYPSSAFTPTFYVSGGFSAPLNRKFVLELETLEPYGVGNRRPQFVIEAAACQVRPLKAGTNHLSVKCDGLDLIYFYGAKYSKLIRSRLPKRLIFDYNYSVFRGREQIKGYLRDVIYQSESCAFAMDSVDVNNLSLAAGAEVDCDVRTVSRREVQSMLDNRDEYGTLFVASDVATLKKYKCEDVEVNLFTLSSGDLADVILISPSSDCDLSAYETVVFMDRFGPITLPSLEGKTVYVCDEVESGRLGSIDVDRENLLSVFRYVGANSYSLVGETLEEIAENPKLSSSPKQAYFALKVFEQLGLVSLEQGRLTVNRGVKTQLTNSGLYNFVSSLKD